MFQRCFKAISKVFHGENFMEILFQECFNEVAGRVRISHVFLCSEGVKNNQRGVS